MGGDDIVLYVVADAAWQRPKRRCRRHPSACRRACPSETTGERVGQTAIVIDDGIATGATARAACRAARLLGAARVVLATPVASAGALDGLRRDADDVVCLETPEQFFAVGQWYADFAQTSDEAVVALLDQAAATQSLR